MAWLLMDSNSYRDIYQKTRLPWRKRPEKNQGKPKNLN